MNAALNAAPMVRAVTASVRDKSSVVVMYDSKKTASSEYITSGPMRTPPARIKRRQ
jgi:hypothetical protein